VNYPCLLAAFGGSLSRGLDPEAIHRPS
jgi:hypothetical protein